MAPGRRSHRCRPAPALCTTAIGAALGLSVLGFSALGFSALGLAAIGAAPAQEPFDPGHWRQVFARPVQAPSPPDNPTTDAKVALGRRLFDDTRLSGGNNLSCSSCHQPALAFSDGIARRRGLDGTLLRRRTPPLWNLAWGLSFFWDGRAGSLEAQAAVPIEAMTEMGGDLAEAAAALARDPQMRTAFAAAFPDDKITSTTIAAALAAFERTLISPRTRFDRWVAGDARALDADEFAGLKLFVGKARCVACHAGWRFTDEAFHDIGLPTTDEGRGAVLDLPAARYAFKTPSLRERVWTAPYMHDGSLPTLEAVVDHYADRVIARPTLSADLPRGLVLSDEERAQLVAFLTTLSSEDPPRPQSLPAVTMTFGTPAAGLAATHVGQRGRRFAPDAVTLAASAALTIVNDDERTHNVRLDDPRLAFVSEAQEPGDRVVISFPEPGRYRVTCGIHPAMQLDVTVTAR